MYKLFFLTTTSFSKEKDKQMMENFLDKAEVSNEKTRSKRSIDV